MLTVRVPRPLRGGGTDALPGRGTLHLPPAVSTEPQPDVAAAGPKDFLVNPGADSAELLARARHLGLAPVQACSILDIGAQPDDFPA